MLENNLKALAKNNPALVNKILNHKPSNVDFSVADSGDYNMVYDGLSLHSEVDPKLEAKQIFGPDDNLENSLRLVFGLGLGYLFKRTYISSQGTIIVFEPIMDILRATLEVVDFTKELSDPRVIIIDNLSDIKIPFYKYMFEKVSLLSLDSYKNMMPEVFEMVYFELNKYFIDQKTNIEKSRAIAESFVANLPGIMESVPTTILRDKFKDKAVLIVSAGPSLDNAINTIKENRDKFIIIAIGQAVKALYTVNIKPDLITVIDKIPLSEQLECLGEKKTEINLILEPWTDSTLYKQETKTRFVHLPEFDFMSRWLAEKAGYETSESGPTVSIAAFIIATITGANPVVLVGQDLAYTDNKLYASNTLYDNLSLDETPEGSFKVNHKITEQLHEEKNAVAVVEKDCEREYFDRVIKPNFKQYETIVKVKGQNGEELNTSNSYASFINVYVELIEKIKAEKPDLKLINSSIGGAFIPGFDHISLDEVVKSLNIINIDTNKIISELYTANIMDSTRRNTINNAIKQLVIDLKALKEDAHKVVQSGNRLLKEVKNSKVLSAKLGDMYNKLVVLDSKVRGYNQGGRVAFIYPFIQKELFEYNKINDKVAQTDKEKVINAVNSLIKYSEVLIIGVNRTMESLDKSKEVLFKE